MNDSNSGRTQAAGKSYAVVLAWPGARSTQKFFFSPEPFQDKEGKGHHRQSHMAVPAIPGAPFEMVQSQLVFELLVILFHVPADFGLVDQFLQVDVPWQVGKPIFYGLGVRPRPFDEKPNDRLRCLAIKVTDGGVDADGCKAPMQRPFRVFTPAHLLPGGSWQVPGYFRNLAGFGQRPVPVGWTAHSPVGRRLGRHRLGPHGQVSGDTQDILASPLLQPSPELGRDPVSGIRYYHRLGQPPGLGQIQHPQPYLPLGLKRYVGRDARLLPPRLVLGPALRQIELEVDGETAVSSGVVQRNRHLAVADLTQGAGILSGHADGMCPLFGKAGVVHDPGPPAGCLPHHFLGQGPTHGQPVPGTLVDELLHGLDIAAQTSRQTRRRFSARFKEQALNIKGPPNGDAQNDPTAATKASKTSRRPRASISSSRFMRPLSHKKKFNVIT